jgi:hypothetical protein
MTDTVPADLGFDPDALRERYAAERAKRIRPEGKDQYLEMAGAMRRRSGSPPWCAPPTSSRCRRLG